MSVKKRYTKEFKLDAVSLVKDQKYSCSEAARSLGVRPNVLSRWVREYDKDETNSFRGNGKLTTDQLEIRRLKEENRRLKLEKEILKKAAAFFAQETK